LHLLIRKPGCELLRRVVEQGERHLHPALLQSPCVMISATSAFSFLTISRGVPAGANKPCAPAASKPGTPDSAAVGACGSSASLSLAVIAMTFNLPRLMNGIAAAVLVIAVSTWPVITSFKAGPLSLYGIGEMPVVFRRKTVDVQADQARRLRLEHAREARHDDRAQLVEDVVRSLREAD
jgi:hypothetical protein